MGLTMIVGLAGGLALFLYGMHMMSAGMEAAAGNRMKQILEKLTSNRFLGVLVGAVITAIIQSSSATTVMVVGFVNSGIMTLRQAVWVIMGANIGTTITGQLIALNVGAIAPVLAFVGVVMVVFVKNQKVNHIGSILAGLGVLFIGMDMMSNAMMPLRELPMFIDMMTKFKNPLIGILVGMVFTAIIQSSSASVGILQALAVSGAIPFSSSVFVLFGQNIGTCITALLASIGTSRNAKRTTVIHLMFNIIGTAIFTVICIVTPLTTLVGGWSPNNPAAQIANMHTLFNIVTTILLIPFGYGMAKVAERILPEPVGAAEKEADGMMFMQYIMKMREGDIGVSAINQEQVYRELKRMMEMSKDNVHKSFTAFLKQDPSYIKGMEDSEEYVDYLNKEISKYISSVITHESNEAGSRLFGAYLKITGNIERISDHAMNICGYSEIMQRQNITLSEEAKEETLHMQNICDKLLSRLLDHDEEIVMELTKISALEQKIDDMTEKYRDNMMIRIKNGTCSEEECVLYSEMLTDFERIGDHGLNIAQELAEI